MLAEPMGSHGARLLTRARGVQAREMVAMDSGNMNDLFVAGKLLALGAKEQSSETDTHWRAKEGTGSFNYRLLYDVELPSNPAEIKAEKPCRLTLTAWDRDPVLMKKEMIGLVQIDLKALFREGARRIRRFERAQKSLDECAEQELEARRPCPR